jgi:hypothetical protein
MPAALIWWRHRRPKPPPVDAVEARVEEVVACLEVRTRELMELVELGRGLTARAAWSAHRKGGS